MIKKTKNSHIVEAPKDTSLVFLLDTAEEAKSVSEILRTTKKHELVICCGLKILYKKSEWEVLET